MQKVRFASLPLLCRSAGAISLGLFIAAAAQAGPTQYYGNDAGATSTSSHAHSNAAQVTFTNAANALPATSSLITFDEAGSLAAGSHPNGSTIASGVTVSTTNMTGTVDILNNVQNNSPITGYNVTTGGSKYLYLDASNNTGASSVTFTFSPGVQGFGSYFVGIGTADGTIRMLFNDGSVQTANLSALIGATNGGLGFFGFLDPTKDITSLSIVETPVGGQNGDVFSMDNIQLVRSNSVSATPEPGIIVTGISMLSMTGLGMVRGRRRVRREAATATA